MQLTSTKYEVLYDNKEGWQDISEIKAMDRISDWYDQISPVLQDLFRGKEISTRNAIFRIKKIARTGQQVIS